MYQPWNSLNWPQIERVVFDFQRQINVAYRNNNIALVRNLQSVLVRTMEAKLLAIKRVTQDNVGKKTPGVDGMLALDDSSRYSIVSHLELDGNAYPIKRVYIPKPNTTEKRPLGIPIIIDRCKQCLVKFALEPEYESFFEYASFGFRPNRSAIDAVSYIRSYIMFAGQALWYYDADISKCFDNINHDVLLKKTGLFPNTEFFNQISAWLKAGIMSEGQIFSPTAGTPQGGVISPLLANLALHGLHNYLILGVTSTFGYQAASKLLYIRYADDFIIIHPNYDVIVYSETLCKHFLSQVGLEPKANSRIGCTIIALEKKIQSFPFDFLGFRFTQRYVSKHKETTYKSGFKTRYKISMVPAPNRIQRHKASITSLMKRIGNVDTLIRVLNPRIIGWCQYFRHSDGKIDKDMPRKLDLWLNSKVRKFIRRTTKKRGKVPEFWKQNTRDWILFSKTKDKNGSETIITLTKYSSFKWGISKYTPLPYNHNPYAINTGLGNKSIKIIK